jgi:putative ABC transport system permease protein
MRLQEDNRILAGRWWNASDQGQGVASVESALAEELGIALGDTLRFQIAGQDLQAKVVSLRSVEWDSFRANFFVVFPSGVLDTIRRPGSPVSICPPTGKTAAGGLVRQYPSVTVLDVEALMSKVREIMDRVIAAVEYVFLFTLAAGLVVLYAAIQATQDERRFESAVLRTLGARRAVVRQSLLAEFATLGLLAGVLAAAAARCWATSWRRRSSISLSVESMDLAAGRRRGRAGRGTGGLLGARSALNQPPWRALRELIAHPLPSDRAT